MRYAEPPLERYTKLDNGCWQWQGHIDRNGYGTAWVDKKNRLAHRLFYKHYRGTLDDSLTIDHLCSNRSCVNPDHLEEVPLSVNAKRARERNAQNTCEKGHLKDKMRADRGYEYMVCSVCQRDYNREYRKNNLEKMRKANREYARKKRLSA